MEARQFYWHCLVFNFFVYPTAYPYFCISSPDLIFLFYFILVLYFSIFFAYFRFSGDFLVTKQTTAAGLPCTKVRAYLQWKNIVHNSCAILSLLNFNNLNFFFFFSLICFLHHVPWFLFSAFYFSTIYFRLWLSRRLKSQERCIYQ